jgi:Ca2+-binding EF-hand superfamily protein
MDLERAARMRHMKGLKEEGMSQSRPRPEAEFDMGKLVRTRLTPEEQISVRTAFTMFATKKNPDILKQKKLWNVFRALGVAPTPLEFAGLVKRMDEANTGLIKYGIFLGEVERYYTQFFSKGPDMQRAFTAVCKVAGDGDPAPAISVAELMTVMLNLGFKLPDNIDDAEEEVFEMIGEIDTKGTGDIDVEDFVKMLTMPMPELPGEVPS